MVTDSLAGLRAAPACAKYRGARELRGTRKAVDGESLDLNEKIKQAVDGESLGMNGKTQGMKKEATYSDSMVAKKKRSDGVKPTKSDTGASESHQEGAMKKKSLLGRLRNSRGSNTATNTDNDDDFVQSEWDELIKAEESLKESWGKMLQAKRDTWISLKESGKLQQLHVDDDEGIDEDLLDEIDKDVLNRMKNKQLMESLQAINKGSGSLTAGEKLAKELENKLVTLLNTETSGGVVAIFNYLTELKDKNIYNATLISASLDAISKSDNAALAIASYNVLRKLMTSRASQETEELNNIIIDYINSLLFSTSLHNAGTELMAEYSKDNIVSSAISLDNIFRVGLFCAKIQNLPFCSIHEKSTPTCDALISPFLLDLKSYKIHELNLVIRSLGRRRYTDIVFKLLDAMKSSRIRSNDETLEYVVNAIVVSVGNGASASSMKDLPSNDDKIPEIVFAGRSNVGKSSLVNFLVNRKALAPTSAKPGETTCFNFYLVNEKRADVPPFYLVDVPGLGYAEVTKDGDIDSWRGLLERYLTVRDNLRIVCHLIDGRHQVTPTDQLMMNIVQRSMSSRTNSNFKYVIIITKADKASKRDLANSLNDVNKVTQDVFQGAAADIPIIVTSAYDKMGREDVWKLLKSSIY